MENDDKMQGNDISDQTLEGMAGGTTPNLGYNCPQCGQRALYRFTHVDPNVDCLACGWSGMIWDVR